MSVQAGRGKCYGGLQELAPALKRLLVGLGVFLAASCTRAPLSPPIDPAYRAETLAWQKTHEAGMKRDWGTLVGLFWLQEGKNSFGSDPNAAVPLPSDRAPEQAGYFELKNGKVSVHVLPGSGFTLNGKPVVDATLASDVSEHPDVLTRGTLNLTVLDREGRFAIRARDTASPQLASFPKLKFFPISERYRVQGKLVRTPQPLKINFPSVNMPAGQNLESPGYVVFKLDGREFRLDATVEGKGFLFVFKDATSGHQTYPPGRFLYAVPGANAEVVMDFNRAYNPPCAFTPYATCPLANQQNTLPIPIEAGEMFSGHE